jgi:hypothetical protein
MRLVTPRETVGELNSGAAPSQARLLLMKSMEALPLSRLVTMRLFSSALFLLDGSPPEVPQ